jgi:hypothetical protein
LEFAGRQWRESGMEDPDEDVALGVSGLFIRVRNSLPPSRTCVMRRVNRDGAILSLEVRFER